MVVVTSTVPRWSVDRPTARALLLAGDGDVDVVAGLGVLVDVDRSQEGVGVVEVEVLDPVLAALVEVDGSGVGDVEDPGAVDRPHQPARFGLVEAVLDR